MIHSLRSPSGPATLLWAGLILATALTCAAADDSMTLVRGRFAGSRIPDEVTLNLVRNGEPAPHSKVKVARDGSFGFYFKPEHTGFYTVGSRNDAARLYLTPGRKVELTLEDGGFSVNGDDRENTLLAGWSKTLHPLKAANTLGSISTYRDIFPLLPALDKARTETALNARSGNKEFDSLFAKTVHAEFEYELYHFLFMPRTAHPEAGDHPEIYRTLASAPHFTDGSALEMDFGLAYANSYIMYLYNTQRERYKDEADPTAAICVQHIINPEVKGWYLAKNNLTRARSYDDAYIARLEKYRPYLATEEQRRFVNEFILTINKSGVGQPALSFEGTTPDGKKVRLTDFKGKVVLVDVWATWCGPCRAETPHLKRLEEEMRGTDAVFISYSVDEPKDLDKWKRAVAAENPGGVQLIGDAAFKSAICTDYKITAIPRFMVFDRKGNIVTIDAPRPSNPDLKRLLEKHLK